MIQKRSMQTLLSPFCPLGARPQRRPRVLWTTLSYVLLQFIVKRQRTWTLQHLPSRLTSLPASMAGSSPSQGRIGFHPLDGKVQIPEVVQLRFHFLADCQPGLTCFHRGFCLFLLRGSSHLKNLHWHIVSFPSLGSLYLPLVRCPMTPAGESSLPLRGMRLS